MAKPIPPCPRCKVGSAHLEGILANGKLRYFRYKCYNCGYEAETARDRNVALKSWKRLAAIVKEALREGRTKMKKFLIIAILALAGTGCGVTGEQLQSLSSNVATLNQVLDQYQSQTIAVMNSLKEQGKVTDAEVAKTTKVNEEIDKVQKELATVLAAVDGVQITGDNIQDILSTASAAVAATAAWNPYAVVISSILGALAMILGVVVKKKGAEAAKALSKYQAHKQGVEAAVRELAAEGPTVSSLQVSNVLYRKIGEARVANNVA